MVNKYILFTFKDICFENHPYIFDSSNIYLLQVNPIRTQSILKYLRQRLIAKADESGIPITKAAGKSCDEAPVEMDGSDENK